MSTVSLKVTAVSIVLLGLAVALLWQQAQIHRLMAEVTDLRAQLAQTVSAPKEDSQLAPSQLSADHPLNHEQLQELLRLRGEVGVLRAQLADALRLTPQETNLPPTERPSRRQEPDLSALNAALAAQELKVNAAKLKTEQLRAALNVPENIAESHGEAVARLDSASLEHYTPYLKAKMEVQELERWARVLRMKIEAAQTEAQR